MITKEGFLKFVFVMFLANIIFYWISPAVHPRYLFMLIPLLYILLTYMYFNTSQQNVFAKKIVEKTLLILCILFTPAALVFPFIRETKDISYIILISILLVILTGFITFLYIRLKSSRLILFVIILLLTRIVFNVFLMSERSPEEKTFKAEAIKVSRLTQNEALYVYGFTPINHDATFYISRERQELLRFERDSVQKGVYYLANKSQLDKVISSGQNVKTFYEFQIKHLDTRLYLFKLSDNKIPAESI